jgi:hypothetical protein
VTGGEQKRAPSATALNAGAVGAASSMSRPEAQLDADAVDVARKS